MPIYEYACSTCGQAFEHLARTLSDKPAKCPSCGAKKLSKLVSSVARPIIASKSCGSCAKEASCPAAAAKPSGCGCAGACSH